MRVFISWSKSASQHMALALRDWLPEVIQQIEPWVSTEDIAKGRRWSTEIAQQLDLTGQGLVCVTRENMAEPWLNFEAGALAKSLGASQVRPVLLSLSPHDVTGPLAEFQATIAEDKDDMFRMVDSLNAVCETPLATERLRRAFDRAWPDLVKKLDVVREAEKRGRGASSQDTKQPVRSSEDILGEVLDRIRAVERDVSRIRKVNALAPRVVRSNREELEIVELVAAALDLDAQPKNVALKDDEVVLFYDVEPEGSVLASLVGEVGVALKRRGIDKITMESRFGDRETRHTTARISITKGSRLHD